MRAGQCSLQHGEAKKTNTLLTLSFPLQDIVYGSTFVPTDYLATLRRWSDPEYRLRHTHTWQLPFVRPDPISEEEKRRRRQEQGERLREFMRKKREKEVCVCVTTSFAAQPARSRWLILFCAALCCMSLACFLDFLIAFLCRMRFPILSYSRRDSLPSYLPRHPGGGAEGGARAARVCEAAPDGTEDWGR